MLYIEASHGFFYILLIIRMYGFAKRVLLQQHHLLLCSFHHICKAPGNKNRIIA